MQPPTVPSLLLMALASLSSATPVPAPDADTADTATATATATATITLPLGTVDEGIFPIVNMTAVDEAFANRGAGSAARRSPDACYGADRRTFDVQNARNMYLELYGDGSYMVYMPHTTVRGITNGNVRYCLYNRYIFDNTHISRNQQATNVQYITEHCCMGNLCYGGEASTWGDSGLWLDGLLQSTDNTCPGL